MSVGSCIASWNMTSSLFIPHIKWTSFTPTNSFHTHELISHPRTLVGTWPHVSCCVDANGFLRIRARTSANRTCGGPPKNMKIKLFLAEVRPTCSKNPRDRTASIIITGWWSVCMCVYVYVCVCVCVCVCVWTLDHKSRYGVARISRLLKIIGLFYKRAL